MVFIDDNPFERNIVRENLPDVCVPEMPEDGEYLSTCIIKIFLKLLLFQMKIFKELKNTRLKPKEHLLKIY